MQFHIPQNIDIEDKIVGPLTLRQAIYLAGGAGAAYFVFRLFTNYLFIALPIIVGIAVLTWALAFYPREKLGRPFIEVLESAFWFFFKGKLYTWKKTPTPIEKDKEESFISLPTFTTPKTTTSKLSSTAFNLDVKEDKSDDDGREMREYLIKRKL